MPVDRDMEPGSSEPAHRLLARRVSRRSLLAGATHLFGGLGAAALVRATVDVVPRSGKRPSVAAPPLPDHVGRYPVDLDYRPVPPLRPTLRSWRGSIGWGYRVSADKSYTRMVDDIRFLRSLGSNTLWLTHANPGWEVDPLTEEANFSLKDFVAITEATADKDAALIQLEALHAALRAAGEAGCKVVLSTGYQTCPGRWWAERYPDDLRRARDGSNPVRKGWGRQDIWYAALDSPRFQDLSLNFGRFVKERIVDQHPGTEIVAIINGDEPNVVDYSTHADAAFTKLYGTSMAGARRTDQAMIGEFQSASWGRLSAWFADLWLQLDPRLWNLHTFHFERTAPWFPSIGSIFAMARPNTAVSYDTHPQDTALQDPFSRDHLHLLKILARTVAYLAAEHGARNERYATPPLMLWAGANRWSLNFNHDEADHGRATVEDAVRSVYDVVGETKRAGGDIAALLAWHYDLPAQRLPEAMQQRAYQAISAAMRDLQPQLSEPNPAPESPSIILTYNERRMFAEIGRLGIFDLYDRRTLPQLLRDRGLSLELLAAENSVVLPRDGAAYTRAMAARPDVREILLF